jgi:hypothetical protein
MYSVSYVTNRVFRGLGKKDDFGASPLTLTSNILTLTILADDPEWDSHRFADVLAKLNDPQLRVNYVAAANHVNNLKSETAQNVARDNRLERTEFVLAQKALNALDTDQAMRERIKLMQMESKSDLDSARQFNTCTQLVQPLLRSTTRADQVVAAMKARAEQPEFAVDCDYVQLWARFLVQRDHPELFRSAETGYSEIQKQLRNYVAYHSGAKRELVELLESLLPSKTGKAAETTAITIQVVKEFSTHETTPR